MDTLLLKVGVEGSTYWIRVKEAPGWKPSLIYDLPSPNLTESALQDQDHNEGHSHFSDGNEDESSDLFGIYKVIEKMKTNELNTDVPKGFNSWGNIKMSKDIKDGIWGKNGNSATDDFFYASPSHQGSDVNTSTASHPYVSTNLGEAVKNMATVTSIHAESQVAAYTAAVSSQATHAAPAKVIAAPTIHFETHTTHVADTEASKNSVPVGFLVAIFVWRVFNLRVILNLTPWFLK
ncbi:unnamed protein product [Lactuca saligna]|uniref:Uncharacterized protein n=1 Tax=Lactuca saligna TaxID=75948 RepID=A0AA35VJW8_LACSI|nr:unnamed protein product [Lactuca saligna]